MKTLKKILFCAVLPLFTACSDAPDKMLTIISTDGSCQREISAMVDSAFMTGSISEKNNPFPVEIDSSYSIVWRYKDGKIRTDFPITQSLYDSIILADTTIFNPKKKKNDFLVFVSQNYKSVEEMSEKFRLKPSHPWSEMDVKYSFEKKFRFFYSYFTYTETYPQVETSFEVPIENYMSKEEADFWFNGEPDLTQGMNGLEIQEYTDVLNEKYNIWVHQNVWNMQYKVLIDSYDLIINSPISKEELMRLRNTIFEKYSSKDDITQDMEGCLNHYFETNAFSVLWKMKDSPMDKFDNEFSEQYFVRCASKSFDYQLLMPGEIVYTNGVNRNDTLSWNISAYRMFRGDYVIEAQSRKINIRMLVLTGMFAATAISIFVYKRRKL